MKPQAEKPVIIFISNRFGYGPTMALLHVVRKFVIAAEANLVFAGSGICKEAFDSRLADKVEFVEIDERDIEQVRALIKGYMTSKVYVVSCLNRFAIQAAKELNVPNALIDFLTWMWNKIPEGYENTDLYFSNHFGTENKRQAMIEVPLILGQIPEKTDCKKDCLLFNVGGMQNHLVSGIPQNYMSLLSDLLNRIRVPEGLKVVVAGGSEAMKFLKERSTRPEFRIGSLPSEEYISIQQRSWKIVSLAGVNSTFMAFAIGIPVIFLLPQVYANWKLTHLLEQREYIRRSCYWEDYIRVPDGADLLSEKDSIHLTETLSAEASNDTRVLERILHDLQAKIDEEVDIAGQGRFICDIGLGGEDAIWKYLKGCWFA